MLIISLDESVEYARRLLGRVRKMGSDINL